MQDGQGRPTPKRATNLANTADILLLENLIIQWHLFMETNRNTTQSHTTKPARGWPVQLGSTSQVPTTCWKPERSQRRQALCPLRGRWSADAHDTRRKRAAEGRDKGCRCSLGMLQKGDVCAPKKEDFTTRINGTGTAQQRDRVQSRGVWEEHGVIYPGHEIHLPGRCPRAITAGSL